MLYDMIVIGGGPGGYTAAMYGARAGMQVLVIERLAAGGQMALTHQVDNYPGFEEGIDGFTLGEKMEKQARRFGVKTLYGQVKAVELAEQIKRIYVGNAVYEARTVVIATGADPRPLGLPEEQELVGRGVAYCAACDGMFYRGKTVAVVGGGNSAVADALLLSRVAKQVILIHRRDTLRATGIYNEHLARAENIEILYSHQVRQILHHERVTGIVVENGAGQQREIAVDGVFISIGRQPATALVQHQLTLDAGGYIVAGEDTATNLPGVFAVGDVRTKQVRQIVTAVADGAAAVHSAEQYLV